MVFPEKLSKTLRKIQDTNLICPTRIAQEAAIEAIKTGQDYTNGHLVEIKHTRETLYDALSSISAICKTPRTRGAFYFLIQLKTELTALELVEQLIVDYKVAIIPGGTFGMTKECCARIAYAALDQSTAKVAIDRLISGLINITK